MRLFDTNLWGKVENHQREKSGSFQNVETVLHSQFQARGTPYLSVT
jgi:hypothetical protein